MGESEYKPADFWGRGRLWAHPVLGARQSQSANLNRKTASHPDLWATFRCLSYPYMDFFFLNVGGTQITIKMVNLSNET